MATTTTSLALGTPRVMSLEMDVDIELVAKARAGDFDAFEKLFERHRKSAFRLAYQMTNRRDDAEDIVQEAFVRAYNNLDRYRDQAKFSTWLLRIVSNLCTDQARTHIRRTALEAREAVQGLDWMTIDRSEDPNDNLVQDDRRRLLRAALAALPAHHRRMIILRDLEERDYPDIAAICGCTQGGAKLRVLRARRALRDRLAPLMESAS